MAFESADSQSYRDPIKLLQVRLYLSCPASKAFLGIAPHCMHVAVTAKRPSSVAVGHDPDFLSGCRVNDVDFNSDHTDGKSFA